MTRKRGRGESTTSPRRLAAAERQRQALDLRLAGLPFRDIALQLSYAGPAGAYKAVNAALRRTLDPPAAELRSLEAERLDRLQFGLWQRALKGDVTAIDRVLRIMNRRAELLGIDARPQATDDIPVHFTLRVDGPDDTDHHL